MFYIIQGQPIPLSRARIGHGSRHMFDSQKQDKRIYAIHIQNQHGLDPILSGPLHLDITFFMKMPKLSPSAQLNKRHQYHFYKPDLSNLLKWVEDVATKVIYNDDCQIAIITAISIDPENVEIRTKDFTITAQEKASKSELIQMALARFTTWYGEITFDEVLLENT